MRRNPLELHVEEHDERLADALAHLGGRVGGERVEPGQVGVHRLFERLGQQQHEIVDARDRVLAEGLVRVREEGDELGD